MKAHTAQDHPAVPFPTYFAMKETMVKVKEHLQSQYGDTSSEWLIGFIFSSFVFVLVCLGEI